MSEAGKKRRDNAAAARDAAHSGEQRRERTVRIVGAATVIVVVLGIIGVAIVARNAAAPADPTAAPSADVNAKLPTGVLPTGDEHAYGIPIGTGAATAPVLEIWEDFQCPACASVEAANGAGIESLAEAGKVRLIWRPTTFLDANLGNDSSLRSAAAWGCAVDAGKAKEFHNVIFANQPATEGDGFTDAQLVKFGTDIGLTGAVLDTYTQCLTDRTYTGWAANSSDIFYSSNIPGTPSAKLDGVEVPTTTLVDQVALEKFITDAAAK